MYVTDLLVLNYPALTVKDGFEKATPENRRQIINREAVRITCALFYASNAAHSIVDFSSTVISIRLDGAGWNASRGGGRIRNRALISDWARYDHFNATISTVFYTCP